jgi:hypothetical protein
VRAVNSSLVPLPDRDAGLFDDNLHTGRRPPDAESKRSSPAFPVS